VIDTHAHLDFENFEDDLREVLGRFFEGNPQGFIVNIGVDFERNLESIKLTKKDKRIFTSIGFHPEILDEMKESFSLEKAILQLEELSQEKKVIAIGEIGLDYFHNSSNKKQQKELFIAQLDFAVKQKMPVVIHCRDAYEDVYEIISQKKYGDLRMVMHCFCGDLKQTEFFLTLDNLNFSFTGNITFPKKDDAEILEVIRIIPIEKIMAETDCPFLAPTPMRGKRNEPSFVKFIIEKIAYIKEMQREEGEKILDQNAIDFFKLRLI
jgi:TatD DNase family protein